MLLQRVAQGRPGRIRAVFLDAEGAKHGSALENATVTVTADNGDVLIDEAEATAEGEGEGVAYFDLTETHTEALDLFTVTWSADGVADMVTPVEVAGGHLFELPELKDAADKVDSELNFSNADMADARVEAEQDLESACNRVFTSRYVVDDMPRTWGPYVRLSTHHVTVLRAVDLDGEAVAPDAFEIRRSRDVWRAAGFRGRARIAYEAGDRITPRPVSRAALALALHYLMPRPSNLQERATSYSTGEQTYQLVTPGVRGAGFSIPDVNAVVERFGIDDWGID